MWISEHLLFEFAGLVYLLLWCSQVEQIGLERNRSTSCENSLTQHPFQHLETSDKLLATLEQNRDGNYEKDYFFYFWKVVNSLLHWSLILSRENKATVTGYELFFLYLLMYIDITVKTTLRVHARCKYEPHTNSSTRLSSSLKQDMLVKLKSENGYSKLVLVPPLKADSTQNCAVITAWPELINRLFFSYLISSNAVWQTPLECLAWHGSSLAAQHGAAFWNHAIHLLKALRRSLTLQTKVSHNNVCI